MSVKDKETLEEQNEAEEEEILLSPQSTQQSNSTFLKFYQLAQSTKSSLNSTVYAVTGIKLNQKRLIVSFIITLIRDFALAYSVRGSLKLIPKLLKMLQTLK